MGCCSTGKAVVHSVAGIDPRFIVPVVLDVGCNTQSITGDRLYIGLRQVGFLTFGILGFGLSAAVNEPFKLNSGEGEGREV